MLEVIMWSFIWMVVALAWNWFINSILRPLMLKIEFLWIIWYLIYAIIVTVLSIFLVITYVNFIGKINKEEEKK